MNLAGSSRGEEDLDKTGYVKVRHTTVLRQMGQKPSFNSETWLCSDSPHRASAWPCELDSKMHLHGYPNTPPRLWACLHWLAQAGSDINSSKLKICRRRSCLGCPGPVFAKEDASHRLHIVMLFDGCWVEKGAAHARQSESPAGCVLWCRHFHSCKFRFGAALCPIWAGDAARSRGDLLCKSWNAFSASRELRCVRQECPMIIIQIII